MLNIKEKRFHLHVLRNSLEKEKDPEMIKKLKQQIALWEKNINRRFYTLKQISAAYGIDKRTLVRRIVTNSELYSELIEAGWDDKGRFRSMPPCMVEIIERHLDPPEH